MQILNGIEELIGNTPLMRAQRYCAYMKLDIEILTKLEYANPAGSAKDRVALSMIRDAEEKGELVPGSVIIEPTSGNTGIGLAAVGSARGYRVVLVMPDTMSVERRQLLQAYGAELVLTDGKLGMTGAIEKANELAKKYDHAFVPGQFENPSNPDAHYKSTGMEIADAVNAQLDCFIAGVGTGGTLSGTGRYLKEHIPGISIIAVEPYDSPVLSGGTAHPHGLQGIGAGFVPKNLDVSVYDEIITVKTEEAYETARIFARTEGILIGVTGGAALFAATRYGLREENAKKRVVVLMPDSGEKYISTGMFKEKEL